MPSQHSRTFGLSGAHRWQVNACTGSVELNADRNSDSSDAAREGTCAHWVASEILNERPVPKPGAVCPESGWVVDEEMIDYVKVYTNDVFTTTFGNASQRMIEYPVAAPSIDAECYGTMDFGFYDPDINRLWIKDYKHGFRNVEAMSNYQLAGYAQAACETLGITDLKPRLWLQIIQPRAFGKVYKMWKTSYEEIQPMVQHMREGAQAYRQGHTSLRSGEHCHYCDSAAVCPAFRDSAGAAVDVVRNTSTIDLGGAQLAYEMSVIQRAEEVLKDRKMVLDEQLKQSLKTGKFVPGYQLQPTYSRVKWTAPVDQLKIIEQMTGVPVFEEKPVTPTQYKNALKKQGIDEAVISPYNGRSQTGFAVERVDTDHFKRIFGDAQ